MIFCPSFRATLRQSFCRSLLLACLSLTLVENTCADERIGSLPSASLSARNQLHERTLSDLSSVQQSALVPRSPRLSLIKRLLPLSVDTSDLPVNLTLTKTNLTSSPETNKTSQTDSQNDPYTDPSPHSNNTSDVPQQKSPALDRSKSKDSNSKLNDSLADPVVHNTSETYNSSSVSETNQTTTTTVPPSTKGDHVNSTSDKPDDKLPTEPSTKHTKPATIPPSNSAVTNQSFTQGVESTDHKANLTSSDSDTLSSGLSSNHSGQSTVTRVTPSAAPNKTGDDHSYDDAYSFKKTLNRTAPVNSDLPPSTENTSSSNLTGDSTGVSANKALSNLTDGRLAGLTANNASDTQSITLPTSAIPFHNDTGFITSSLSGNHSGASSSDKSAGSQNESSNIPVFNNTSLQNLTLPTNVTGLVNPSNISSGQGLDTNKQLIDNATALVATNKSTSANLSTDSNPSQNVTSEDDDDDSSLLAPYLNNTAHNTSDVKHNVSSIDDDDASSDDDVHRNVTGSNLSPLNSSHVKNLTSDDNGPDSILPDMYLNRTGLSNNFTIPEGFNGTGIPLSDFKSSHNSSGIEGGIGSPLSHSNASSNPYFDGADTDVIQNLTIPAGVNGTGIPMSAFKSSNDTSDIKGSIDSAFSHLGSSSNLSDSELPHVENYTDVTPFNVSGKYNANVSDQAAAALWRLNETRTGLSNLSKDRNYTLLPSDSDDTTTTAGSGFSIGPNGSSVGNLTLANLTSESPLYKNTSVIPLNGEASNSSLLNTGVLPINASLPNATGGALLANATANYTDHIIGKLAWNASLNSTQNNTLNASLASVSPHNATVDEPTPVALNHTLPVAAPAFVPVSSLFTNPTTPAVEPNLTNTDTPAPKPKPAAPETQASFPTTWPRYIVPSNTPTSPPDNSTLISILFSNALSWPWLVTNSNASSQVLVFMPALISTALNIDPSEVVTQSLQAYQPADFAADDESAMLTIWLGFIPNQYVNTLQAMLKDPQSAFYNQSNPIYAALSKTVDPSLPITTFSSQARAAQRNAATTTSSESPPSANQGQKAAVIASVTSCGAAILAIGLFLAARQSKQKLRPGRIPFSGDSSGGRRGSNLRALHLPSNGRFQISSPMIGTLSHNAGHASHYYGQGAQRPQSFAGHSAFPIGQLNGAEPGATEPNVHYEYGHARTTSADNQSSSPPADTRSSWWRFNQEDLEEPQLQEDRFDSSHLAEPTPLERQGNSLRRSDGSFAVEASQRSGPRRLQITRGADGLVSGIGRPVMKENSLFF